MEQQEELEQEAQPASKEADLERIFSDFNLEKEGKNSQLWADLLEWKRHKYWAVPKKYRKRMGLVGRGISTYILSSQIKIDQKENTLSKSV